MVLRRYSYLALMAVPVVLFYALFHYARMYGLFIAFKDCNVFKASSAALGRSCTTLSRCSATGVHGIRFALDETDRTFMVLELEPGALAGCTGVARYVEDFKSP